MNCTCSLVYAIYNPVFVEAESDDEALKKAKAAYPDYEPFIIGIEIGIEKNNN